MIEMIYKSGFAIISLKMSDANDSRKIYNLGQWYFAIFSIQFSGKVFIEKDFKSAKRLTSILQMYVKHLNVEHNLK